MPWVRVKKGSSLELCPICGKPDGCSVSSDGKVACCSRVESDKLVGEPFAGGWIHNLSDDFVPPKSRPKKKRGPPPDFTKLAMEYQQGFNPEGLAKELGKAVSAESLVRLQVGYGLIKYSNRSAWGYTFPTKNENQKITGIATRHSFGFLMVPSSKPGLFIPTGLTFKTKLFMPEGASDVATFLTLGLEAVGRPSNSGGKQILFALLEKHKVSDVIVVAEKDKPKRRPDGSWWRPGIDGAGWLVTALKPLRIDVRVIKPPSVKDVREWVNSGATAKAIKVLVEGSRYE